MVTSKHDSLNWYFWQNIDRKYSQRDFRIREFAVNVAPS